MTSGAAETAAGAATQSKVSTGISPNVVRAELKRIGECIFIKLFWLALAHEPLATRRRMTSGMPASDATAGASGRSLPRQPPTFSQQASAGMVQATHQICGSCKQVWSARIRPTLHPEGHLLP